MTSSQVGANLTAVESRARKWRATEYERRCARLTGRRQPLEPRDDPSEHLHVVYVMAHVATSGGVKIILDHANVLTDRGVKVTIVCHYPKPSWYPVRCEYRQVPFQVELAAGIPPCDVIVATYWDHIQACVDTGLAPVVYFEQGDFHLFEEISPDLHRTVQSQIQAAADVVTCSPRAAKIILQRYGRNVSHVFLNAVDPRIFHPRRTQDPRVPDKPYLMMMGNDRLAFKGTTDVLQAWALAREAGVDLDLVWVSPVPPERPVGQVYVNPDQELLAELYRHAEVFVSGSHYEAFSLPPLEAMACGCPVISTANEGVLTYAIGEENCLLAEVGNPSDLAAHIVRLMTDGELRTRLREAGLRTAANYTWETTAEQLEAYYRHLSELRPAPRNCINDWVLSARPVLSGDGEKRLQHLMLWTDADVILAPAIVEVFEGHRVARWHEVAKRKNTTTGREERLWVPIQGVPSDLPYAEALKCFADGRFREALKLFIQHYQQSHDLKEKAVYVRWVVLCLIELEQDRQALEILCDALTIHSSNTDLCYLKAVVLSLQGRWGEAAQYLEPITVLSDSADYPEFFWEVQRLAQDRLLPSRDCILMQALVADS